MRHLALLLAGLLTAQAASAALGDNSVGMNIHDGRQTFVDACAELGVQWVRLDANWWVIKDGGASAQHWGYLDDAVNRATGAGLQVFITLAYTPAWVPRRDNGDGWHGNDLPNSSTEWVAFVSEAVNRYQDRVSHFGLWNESNLDGFLAATPAEYWSRIVAPGAAAVRAACPGCKVLGPDLANVGEVDDYLEELLAQPAINGVTPVQAFDILTHHIYQSFPELGVDVWDGDRFFNALDQQRFTWPVASRRSLRQVLDAAGWAGEVWITETGYRATVDDAADEQNQATYLPLVLQEQLARDWYTNTFFYEIFDCRPDQPDCDIDGFGLMHAIAGSPGSRSFPADFRLKPAFAALKQFLLDHPELTGQGSRPACSDGVDNDGDGRRDGDDRGCSSALDDDESDDPPRRELAVYRTAGLVVDGALGDFGSEGWLSLGGADWVGSEAHGGDADISLRAAARWDSQALYLAVEVTDDSQVNDHAAAELWQGDSLQLGFDIAQSGGSGYDSVDDHELNFGLSGSSALGYRHHGPAAASDAWQIAIVRGGTRTRYELRLPLAVLPGVDLAAGSTVGFSFLVNEDDGAGRLGWLEFTPGIGQAKVPEQFGELLLRDELATVGADAGGSDDAATPPDAGSGADAGQGGDAAIGGDGSAGVDSAAATDAGPADQGLGADTGAGDRAVAAGSDAGGEPVASGCSCAGTSGRGALLPALLLLGWRRRR